MLYLLYRKEICKYESEMPNVRSRFYKRQEKSSRTYYFIVLNQVA